MPLALNIRCTSLALALALAAALPAMAQFDFEPSWQPRRYEEVRAQVFSWIDDARPDSTKAQEARSLWPSVPLRELPGPALLDLVVETVGLLDERTAKLITQCHQMSTTPLAPDATWIADSELPKFVKDNLQLYVARWLTQQSMYDDALDIMANLTADDVADPASLFFCRMVAHHQVVEPDESRAALVELLEQEEHLPLRYRQVAEMIEQDLSELKDESLDHVSRRMNDVRRRLELGQAGTTVQVVEKGVVDSLDKLIKKLEEQQQQSSGRGGGSAQSAAPMQDSQLPGGLRAPGRVDQRDIGHESGWGNLPPKEREEALQQIGREYPAHYRQLIEQYFRDLADQSTDEPSK